MQDLAESSASDRLTAPRRARAVAGGLLAAQVVLVALFTWLLTRNGPVLGLPADGAPGGEGGEPADGTLASVLRYGAVLVAAVAGLVVRSLLPMQQALTQPANEPDARADARDALAHQAALAAAVLLCGSVFNAVAMWLCGWSVWNGAAIVGCLALTALAWPRRELRQPD